MPRISCVTFNQDGSRLAVGFEGGLSVFSSEPVSFLESVSAPSPATTPSKEKTSTVTAAALLYKTRVSALVLASQPNVVALHDGGGGAATTASSSLLGELSVPESTKVVAVRLRRDAVAVALSDGRAAAYSLDSLRLLRSVETGPNELGLLALAAGGTRTIFACPAGSVDGEGGEEDKEKEKEKEGGGGGGLLGGRGGFLLRGGGGSSGGGSRAPRRAGGTGTGTVRVEFVDAGRSVLVRAARHEVAALALSQAGELLATAGAKGTLVRIFALGDVEGASSIAAAAPPSSSWGATAPPPLTPCLRELRRGGDPARMLSLAFSPSVAAAASFSSSSSSSAETSTTAATTAEEKRQQQHRPGWIAAASDKGTVHVWNLSARAPPPPTTTTSHVLLGPSRQLLAAAAAAAGAPSPSSLAAERSAFHFKLPGFFGGGGGGGGEREPALAALSFSPCGKAVFAASATSSGKGAGAGGALGEGEEGGSRSSCGLVAVALPEEAGENERAPSSYSTAAAAAEVFCVPDLFALLPQ